MPDGNYFYRILSYYFRDKEDNFNEFGILISEFIINNYIPLLSNDQVNIEENQKDDFNHINILKKEYIKKYEENENRNTTLTGEVENNIAINCDIRVYISGNGVYTLYNEFNNNINDNSAIK